MFILGLFGYLLAITINLIAFTCSHADQLSYVRFGQHNDFSRIVLDLDKSEPYRVMTSKSSKTLSIAFPQIKDIPDKATWHAKQTLIQDVRFVAGRSNIEVEITLRSPGKIHRTFRLASFNRLVIDVIADETPAPDQKKHSPTRQRQTHAPPPRTPVPPYHRQLAAPAPASAKKASAPAVKAPPPRAEATTTSKPPSAQKLLEQAEREWHAGQYERAQQSYSTFLRSYPNHRRNHLIAARLADILREQKQYRQALEAYAKVAQDYPRSEGALISQIRMAEFHLADPELIPAAEARHEESYLPFYAPLQTLQHIVREYPFHSLSHVARHTMAQIFLKRGDVDAAFDILKELFHTSISDALRREVEPKFYETLGLILQEHVDQGDYTKALEVFFKAKSEPYPMDSMHPDLIVPISKSYAGLGLLNEAAHLLGLLLKTDKLPSAKRQEISVQRAQLLFQNGQAREAKTQLEPFEQFSEAPIRRQAIRLLSDIAIQEKQPDASLHYMSLIEPFSEADIGQSTAYARLGRSFEKEGNIERALDMYQRCAESSQRDASTYLEAAEICLLRMGKIYQDQKRHEQALTTYETLLKAFPQTGYRDQTLLYIARSYKALDNRDSMMETLMDLKENTKESIWKRISEDYLDESTWQSRFREYMSRF